MPYQIMKYENIAELKHTPRVSPTAILFGSLSGGLTLLYVHIIVDNSTKQLCGEQQARKNERLLSSFNYNHDLSAQLFCIKLNFMITLIALFMRLSCFMRFFCFSPTKKLKLFILYNVPWNLKWLGKSATDPLLCQRVAQYCYKSKTLHRFTLFATQKHINLQQHVSWFNAIHYTSLYKILMLNGVYNHQIKFPYSMMNTSFGVDDCVRRRNENRFTWKSSAKRSWKWEMWESFNNDLKGTLDGWKKKQWLVLVKWERMLSRSCEINITSNKLITLAKRHKNRNILLHFYLFNNENCQ